MVTGNNPEYEEDIFYTISAAIFEALIPAIYWGTLTLLSVAVSALIILKIIKT